ncbi:MAG: 5'/3'-nucleotidase SurE [Candidatus Sumerlaeia bacterium]
MTEHIDEAKNDKPLILITNDDGIDAPGIRHLYNAVQELGEVLVVAPTQQCSATSHTVTIFRDMEYRQVHHEDRLWGHALDGMPADCVKFGALHLADRLPNLLLSGINPGSNVGNNILYSGTVGAAREGAMLGIPSAAFSLDCRDEKNDGGAMHFDAAEYWANWVARNILENGLPRGVYLNVNIPNLPLDAIGGAATARQGRLMFIDEWQPLPDAQKPQSFANRGSAIKLEGREHEDVDDAVLRSGRVAISPLHFDTTHHESMQWLKQWRQGE